MDVKEEMCEGVDTFTWLWMKSSCGHLRTQTYYLFTNRGFIIFTLCHHLVGAVFYFTEEGTCTEVLNTEGALLKKILYHEHKDNLIVMTEDLNVGQFQVSHSGQVTEVMKVRTPDIFCAQITSYSIVCHSLGS
jgi:hypothetical protein